jgi:transcription-repair coupling factor (superfamily II helicase)
MSLTGIREMSTILTPPEERHPVLTFVGPYDEKQIGAAIRRELLREGQIFFVHNRVESIDRVAKRIRELVPRPASPPATVRWARPSWSRSWSASGRRTTTSWSAPRSSSPAWTSRTRTR